MNGKKELGDGQNRVRENHQQHMGMFRENPDSAAPNWYFFVPLSIIQGLEQVFILFWAQFYHQ